MLLLLLLLFYFFIDLFNVFVDSNSVAGESSLDRLACGLGGKAVLPHIIVTVPQMLQNREFPLHD